MERLFKIRIFTVAFLLAVISMAATAKENKKEGGDYHAKQILILGLHDNVKSNYFYNGMIAEETGMRADSIDQTYNTIIAENIAASAKNGDCKFIPANSSLVSGEVLNEILVNGESENSYSDLSAVPSEELRKVLDRADADYLLVLNQHYLKWQDQPLRTLFHIISYSLFDKDKKEIFRGNHFFTCMNLENPDKLRKSSRKSSSKIASSIMKTLDKD